jgi:hypothetical protein
MIRIFVAGIFILSVSCAPPKSDEVRAQEIYSASIKIHDAIMPRMDELYRQQQRLKSILADLKQDSIHNAQKISIAKTSLRALEDADAAMMHWMHNIKVAPGNAEDPLHPAEATAGLEAQRIQLQAIEAVRDAMEKSISDAAAIQE